MPLLTVTDLCVRYGPIFGTTAVSFDAAEGEVVALVGSNGAGKSSVLKAIVGAAGYDKGEIRYDGKPLAAQRTAEIIRSGVGFSPEGRRVFPQFSVLENLRIGGYCRTAPEAAARIEEMFEYFPRLRERKHQRAGALSGGEQQMLAIGRALMARPKLFLLDEPSLGLAPIVVERIGEILQEVQRRERMAVVLAEQNAAWAMSIATKAVVIELGRSTDAGAPADLMVKPSFRSAYLGI